jgi:DNA modification methylase
MTDDLTLADLPQPAEQTTVHPGELHVDGDNPNEQSDEMFGLLVENMRSKGWLGNAIVADTDGCIADGEHRWRAAQEIGLTEVPVKFYAIDDAERRLWRQELNKISGEHDAKRDALEYDHLLANGHSDDVEALVDATGEDLDELLAELRTESGRPPAYEYDPDHNVYFEDCVAGMRERLADDSVDCVVTDPPYGIDFQSGYRYETATFDRLDADEDAESAVALYADVVAEVSRVLRDGGHFYTFTRWDVYPHFYAAISSAFDVRSRLIWYKDNHSMGDLSRDYAPMHEGIIYAVAGDGDPLRGTRPADVLEHARPDATDRDHPTEKPVPLLTDLITNSTDEGDRVLDPFMGSGTTAVAAIQTDRDYVGFEVDAENYRPVIERRIGEAKRQREASVNQE